MAAFHSIIYGRFWVITKVYKRTPELVEFKWRLKGQEGARDNWQINEKGLQYTREQLKDKVKGISDFTLWYAPKS
jgi:hypothetical protein